MFKFIRQCTFFVFCVHIDVYDTFFSFPIISCILSFAKDRKVSRDFENLIQKTKAIENSEDIFEHTLRKAYTHGLLTTRGSTAVFRHCTEYFSLKFFVFKFLLFTGYLCGCFCSSDTLRTFSLRATKSQRLFEKLRTGWAIRYCMYSNKRRGFYLRAAFIELRYIFFYFWLFQDCGAYSSEYGIPTGLLTKF